MRHSFRGWLVIVAMFVGGQAGLVGGFAQAKGKSAGKADATASSPAKAVNACGCYKDTAGACFCGRKGKCACPGDCEPKGCDEKRAKEIQKEIAVETKKAALADKKQRKASHDSEKKPTKKKSDGVGQ
jgi:hypothetical protein